MGSKESPWLDEPDHLRWTSRSGLDCVIHRHEELKTLNGYVRVRPGHPFFGMDRRSPVLGDLEVHGGLTYSGFVVPGEEGVPGEWWFGFDCAHAFDLVPMYLDIPDLATFAFCTYRGFPYVEAECESLADEISGLASRVAQK